MWFECVSIASGKNEIAENSGKLIFQIHNKYRNCNIRLLLFDVKEVLLQNIIEKKYIEYEIFIFFMFALSLRSSRTMEHLKHSVN